MAPESSDRDEHLTPEELLTDPLYVKQHAETYRLAAQVLASQIHNLSDNDFGEFYALYSAEVVRLRAKYPNYNKVATLRGLVNGGYDAWTAVDFPGDDAILGPNLNSLESKLRVKFPAAFPPDLPAFVPPSGDAVQS